MEMKFKIEHAKQTDGALFADTIFRVHENMEHKEWFAIDNEEYMTHMLQEGNGIGYLAKEVETDNLAAVFLVTFPGNSDDNLGRDIGLSEEELNDVAHMDTVGVFPEYRGNRLQYRLMQNAENELREKGYRYLMCTVHPDNPYSRKNVIDQGYEPVKKALKYGGFLREIFVKYL